MRPPPTSPSSVATSQKRRVVAYIDGFNLYHGIRDAYGRRFLWLDLQRLCSSLLLDDQELTATRYFTAPVRQDKAALRRQQKFWNALAASCPTLSIELGRFQQKSVACRSCHASWHSYEEKETDVAIATALVEDAARAAFDTALLVSADSDLCPAVRSVKRLHPDGRVVAAFPPRRRSDELRRVVNGSFTIAERKLKSALLPNPVHALDGKLYPRPQRWH